MDVARKRAVRAPDGACTPLAPSLGVGPTPPSKAALSPFLPQGIGSSMTMELYVDGKTFVVTVNPSRAIGIRRQRKEGIFPVLSHVRGGVLYRLRDELELTLAAVNEEISSREAQDKRRRGA